VTSLDQTILLADLVSGVFNSFLEYRTLLQAVP